MVVLIDLISKMKAKNKKWLKFCLQALLKHFQNREKFGGLLEITFIAISYKIQLWNGA